MGGRGVERTARDGKLARNLYQIKYSGAYNVYIYSLIVSARFRLFFCVYKNK